MPYKVKDLSLAHKGRLQIEWAKSQMKVLKLIMEEFEKEKPLRGEVIAAVLHVTKETGFLMEVLKLGGAEVYLAGSNPLSTQDDVAAALAEEGINVFAWRGETKEEYYKNIEEVISSNPTIVMDDGADLHALLHSRYRELARKLKGGTEETTTGVIRLRSLHNEKGLLYPVIAVNDAYTKYLFDNRYGTGQSTVDGILRATSVLLAGKRIVVVGYGWVGRGIAMRMRGMGANVIVTEVSPLRALEALMDGYEVMKLEEACRIGDIFITATGNYRVIDREHIEKMKDGVILANSGHFNVEINVDYLEEKKQYKREVRQNLTEYLIGGKRVYLIGEGRLVNLVAAEGHPSEVMDMSFSNQALSVELLSKRKLEVGVYKVPDEIDDRVARLKLRSMGVEIDELNEAQRKYLSSWLEGTT
jgi:adenosylhomocysteinase